MNILPERTNRQNNFFITPDNLQQHMRYDRSPSGWLAFASCQSGSAIAQRTLDRYHTHLQAAGLDFDLPHLKGIDFRFSDQETCARLEQGVRGADVYLFQSLVDPASERSVDENLMALLTAARALREWGTNHLTAVLPYLAYARQEKSSRGRREPVTARLVADLIHTAGIQQVVTWDPHGAEIQGFFDGLPVIRLSAANLFVQAFEQFRGREEVIAIAPDAGAAARVLEFCQALDIAHGVTRKQRPRPEEAVVSSISGDFHGCRTAIILDDMISSGGTISAVIDRLVEFYGIETIHVGVSHLLGRQFALTRLREYHSRGMLASLVVTDSIPPGYARQSLPFIKVKTLADIFARVVNRLHYRLPLSV